MVKGNVGGKVNKFVGRARLVESRRRAECGLECGSIDVDQFEMALKGGCGRYCVSRRRGRVFIRMSLRKCRVDSCSDGSHNL